jgi:hypothetical protein
VLCDRSYNSGILPASSIYTLFSGRDKDPMRTCRGRVKNVVNTAWTYWRSTTWQRRTVIIKKIVNMSYVCIDVVRTQRGPRENCSDAVAA